MSVAFDTLIFQGCKRCKGTIAVDKIEHESTCLNCGNVTYPVKSAARKIEDCPGSDKPPAKDSFVKRTAKTHEGNCNFCGRYMLVVKGLITPHLNKHKKIGIAKYN